MKQIMIVKRDGRKEPLDLSKMHFVVEEAVEGLSGVSSSLIEMNAGLQFIDGMTSQEIQQILIKSAADLITLENPNYQYAAARLLLSDLRKQVFGKYTYSTLQEVLDKNIGYGVYDPEILTKYTSTEFKKINTFIKHDRDMDFTFAGLSQMVDKYLVQDRTNGKIFETPQFAFVLVAATLFADYPSDTRLHYVKAYYDALSTFKINLPTPVLSGVRTPTRQFASCVLVDIGDSLDSIFNSSTAIGKYSARRAGLGINIGRIRGINSRIRGGEVSHTGVVPFLKVMESTIKSTSQNGIRGSSATVNFPFFHQEIESVVVLKNNKGTDENRARKLDYCIHLSKLFYERIINDQDISLFSPHEARDLFDCYGLPEFDDLYVQYEQRTDIYNRRINALTLMKEVLKERLETGRIYIMHIDHANSHSAFLDRIAMTNLCVEINLPTTPIEHIDDMDPGEIALCILTSINVGLCKDPSDLEVLTDLAVRALDELIDYQDYPVAAALKTLQRRSLGVGFTGLAHYLAKHKVKYDDIEAARITHDLAEALQYFCLKASNQLAQEKGPCGYFDRTKYSRGILPIDTYKKDIDKVLGYPALKQDWDTLRANIVQHGLRHSTLTAQAPVESCQAWTNKLNLSDGRKLDFHEIFDEIGFNWRQAETVFMEKTWYVLPQPISVIGEHGDELVERVFYNGFVSVYEVHFEDGNIMHFTGNHRLLVKYANGNGFEHVRDIAAGDKIVHLTHIRDTNTDEIIQTIESFVRISFIKFIEPTHTWDISTPSETFLLPNGCVSHNSSLVTNSTNGIEPVKSLLTIKKSKKGVIKQIVPQYASLKHNYTLQWDMVDNLGYTNIVASIQKFFDQSISANLNYDPLKFPDHQIPIEQALADLLYSYKVGQKTHYYCNIKDGKVDAAADMAEYDKQQESMYGKAFEGVEVNLFTMGHNEGVEVNLTDMVMRDNDDDYCDACTL